jgi:hypothetical protein
VFRSSSFVGQCRSAKGHLAVVAVMRVAYRRVPHRVRALDYHHQTSKLNVMLALTSIIVTHFSTHSASQPPPRPDRTLRRRSATQSNTRAAHGRRRRSRGPVHQPIHLSVHLISMINIKTLTININNPYVHSQWLGSAHEVMPWRGRLMGSATRWRRAATPIVAALAAMASACASSSASGGDY